MRVYARRTTTHAVHFLQEHVLEEMPFPIQSIQTDHGTEFTAYPFQDALATFSIKFRPIRPASPHLNGKVERAQKTVLTEFFALYNWTNALLEQINEALGYWQHYDNWERLHASIHQLPTEKLQSLWSQTPFWDEVIAAYDAVAERKRLSR